MTPKIIDDLQHAIEEHGTEPVHVVDRSTKKRYVLVPEEQYERLKALLGADEDLDPRELYPVIEKAFGKAGWDDPAMDVYNDDDAHRPKP